jgi:hypothetical protein
MGTPIYLLLGFDFVHHFGRYLLFIATLGEHALLYRRPHSKAVRTHVCGTGATPLQPCWPALGQPWASWWGRW